MFILNDNSCKIIYIYGVTVGGNYYTEHIYDFSMLTTFKSLPNYLDMN